MAADSEDIDISFDNEQNNEDSKFPDEMELEVGNEDLVNTEDSIIYGTDPSTCPKDDSIPKQNESKKLSKSTDTSSNKKESVTRYRPLHLPLARVKQIIKMDPEVHMASSESVFVIAKAAELFIEHLSKDAHAFTVSSKKKTIQKKDIDSAISNTDALTFLDGALDF